jgi:hypothetical protein
LADQGSHGDLVLSQSIDHNSMISKYRQKSSLFRQNRCPDKSAIDDALATQQYKKMRRDQDDGHVNIPSSIPHPKQKKGSMNRTASSVFKVSKNKGMFDHIKASGIPVSIPPQLQRKSTDPQLKGTPGQLLFKQRTRIMSIKIENEKKNQMEQ